MPLLSSRPSPPPCLRRSPSFRVEGVFQKDIFDLASPHLQRLREKVAMYSFRVYWVPGKTHLIADALLCAPLFAPKEHPVWKSLQTSHPTIDLIYNSMDDDYRLLLDDIKNETSFSTYSQSLKAYLNILSLSDGLVLIDSKRIVLPLPSVKPILKLLHASHSGVTKTTNLPRGLYFWPGMTNGIRQMVSSCVDCTRVLQSQPSNPMSDAPPSSHFGFPMQHVGLDLFSFGGKDNLICVDHWSGYPLYQLLRSLTSETVIRTLSTWFNLLGWPSSIRSDGGPQFRGDFVSFCQQHGIRHELSAPYNPKSNGLAEAGVKSVKKF